MEAIERYFAFCNNEVKDASIEEHIVYDLFTDMRGRKGLLDDVDSEIQNEILEEWIHKVRTWVR